MIFATVGTQFPFERMLRMVENASKEINVDIFYQIGPSNFKPKSGKFERFLDSEQYDRVIGETRLIVGHAGMGTIITAMERRIPAIIVPRMYSLGEHRNDHQVSTAKRFSGLSGVYIVNDENEMRSSICSVFENETEGAFFENSALLGLGKALQSYIV